MKSAQQIYDEYNIMPSLQLHQLRVASVAKLICENFERPVKEQDVVLACLFHDMGNIIKSDLSLFPEFRADKGIQYWEGIKSDFIEKYGDNAHEANVAIAKEIGLPSESVAYIDGISFSNLEMIASSDSLELKIGEYGDLRAGPYGILPLRERLEEARARYVGRGKSYYTREGFLRLFKSAEQIEKQIFESCKLKAEDITDASIESQCNILREYPIA